MSCFDSIIQIELLQFNVFSYCSASFLVRTGQLVSKQWFETIANTPMSIVFEKAHDLTKLNQFLTHDRKNLHQIQQFKLQTFENMEWVSILQNISQIKTLRVF